jgi:hypothetical protein
LYVPYEDSDWPRAINPIHGYPDGIDPATGKDWGKDPATSFAEFYDSLEGENGEDAMWFVDADNPEMAMDPMINHDFDFPENPSTPEFDYGINPSTGAVWHNFILND